MRGEQLPDKLLELLAPHLPGPIEHVAAAGGGCIAQACRVEVGGETYFLKWGRDEAADTFQVEAAGLEALRSGTSLLQIPAPLAARDRTESSPGFLLMTWIEAGRPDAAFWEALGCGLADLHGTTAEQYGFEHDNRIGRLPQDNAWEPTWPAFFRKHRLEPQVAMARENGRWSSAWNATLDALYRRLEDVLPLSPPASLLHGDLWSGNVMAPTRGLPVLIDPAVYYGHREADLAMSELFGGFDRRFYASYEASWPLESGYAERKDVYNLYHLINHLNHFGGAYAGSVGSTFARL